MPTAIAADDQPKLIIALRSFEGNHWTEVIRDKIETLNWNGTREKITELPWFASILPSGIILKLKWNSLGRPIRFKAREVAGGNFQIAISNYCELYALVAWRELVTTLFKVAVATGSTIHLVHVTWASLHALLPESDIIYMKLPNIAGMKTISGEVASLINSLHGLWQAPKLQYGHSFAVMKKLEYKRAYSCACLFTSSTPNEKTFLPVYVDDILIFGTVLVVWYTKPELACIYGIWSRWTKANFWKK